MLTNLSFFIGKEETTQLFSRLLEHSPDLFEISFEHISNEGLRLIASSHCAPSLRNIECRVNDNALELIKTICKSCPNLRELIVGNDDFNLLGDEIIHTAVEYCPLIEVLSIHMWHLTDVGLDILASIHTLTELKVTSDECTRAAVQRVIEANTNLTLLRIDVADIVDEALVRCIGHCCRNLTILLLYRSAPSPALVSSNAFCDLFRGCPLLEYFQLRQQTEMPNTAIRAMFQYCTHLAEVTLLVGKPTEASLLDVEPVLYTNYPSLTKLRVTGDGNDGEGLAYNAFRSIFTHCFNLQEVHISNCNQITDEVIKVLAQHCNSLDSLTLVDCGNVSMSAILEVVKRCTKLKTLILYNMPISDELLIQLSHHCLGLSRFHCSDGVVTEAGLLVLLEGCSRLSFLTLRGPVTKPLLTTLDLGKLKQIYPHIEFEIAL